MIQRLKHQTPRQVDLNFEELIDKFRERQRLYEGSVMRDGERQAERWVDDRVAVSCNGSLLCLTDCVKNRERTVTRLWNERGKHEKNRT